MCRALIRLAAVLMAMGCAAHGGDSPELCSLPQEFDFQRCGGHYAKFENREISDSTVAYLGLDTLYVCLDGELVTLPHTSQTVKKGRRGALRVGDVVEDVFSSGTTTLKTTLTVTLICPTADEPDCESIEFKGTLEVETSGAKRVYEIYGSFGC